MPFAEILRQGRPWATLLDRVARWTAGPPSVQPPVPVRTRWATGWAPSAVPPAGWLPNEVGCHDMRKKVVPFPPRKAAPSPPVIQGHSRITVQVGAQRYTLHIPCEAVGLPPEPVRQPGENWKN